MNLKALGTKLGDLRKAKGLSLELLSARSSVAKNTINQLEKGRGNPTLETLNALAKPLGVDLADILRSLIPTAKSNPPPDNLNIGPVTRLMVALDADPILKGFVFATALGDESYIDQIDLGVIRKLLQSRFGPLLRAALELA